MYRFVSISVIVVAILSASSRSSAQPELIRGLGGPTGFGTQCLEPNDDGSSSAISLTTAFPGGLEFFGTRHVQAFVNTNGNITFAGPLSTFTPNAFPVANRPMIAPYWADVDIRGVTGSCATRTTNGVWWHLSAGQLVVTWDRVGYFSINNERQMTFQLIVREARYCGIPGDFDVEFRYTQCEWETGDASGGTNGFGGTPAQIGFDAGNTRDYVAITGSRMAGISRVACEGSNVGEPGVWRFQIRRGVVECPDAGTECTIDGAIGACASGRTACVGAGLVCQPIVDARDETCDNFDNDCDGTVDEGDALCGGLQVCDRGRCIDPCFEGGCSPGYECSESGVCLESACNEVACAASERCVGGACVGVCDGISCPPGFDCVGGTCQDLCDGIECGACEYCQSGNCRTRCEVTGCPSGQACDETGVCVTEACLGVICGPGRTCRDGRCANSCDGVTCPAGEVCSRGMCGRPMTPDAGPAMPDAGTEGDDAGVGVDAGIDGGPRGEPPLRDRGGCGCTVPGGSGSAPSPWMLVLALGAVLVIRRRGGRLLPFVVAAALLVGASACTTRDGTDGMMIDDGCGDSIITFPELCDDGNTMAGDGCSPLCFVEAGWQCTGSPSVCTERPVEGECGDRAINIGEDCDDGTETAECDLDCTTVMCGDGTVNRRAGEECDDGNTVDGDGCSARCFAEPATCGNGTCDPAETCNNCVPDCASTVACVDCPDNDGDGYKDSACGGDDCNDEDPAIHPGATEIPCNRIDEDCNPATRDAIDADMDGSSCNFDCDDNDPARSPLFLELCGDGIDNDCNPATPDILDRDGDGALCDVDCDDFTATTCPTCPEICDNGIDDDCNPATPDRFDADGDGSLCNVDCDDSNPAVRPGAPELCDGLDNDCNGSLSTAEDADRDGWARLGCGAACVGRCGDCDDTNPAVNPGATEICGNGIDDDCDPATSDELVDLDGDGAFCDVDCDDDDAALVPNAAGICGPNFAYAEGFEAGPGGWTATGSWQHGRPTGTIINRAASGTHAWVTNLAGNYPNSEMAFLTSPRLDMSMATGAIDVSFALIFVTEGCCDWGWLEVSTNGGSSWTKVGAVGAGTRWYNRTENQTWSGEFDAFRTWGRSSISVSGLAGRPDVRFRFVFRSDTSSVREGFGIDDIRIGDQIPDLAVVGAGIASSSGCGGASAPVTATVRNNGTTTIGAFDLHYTVDGGTRVTERVTRTLRPGQSYEHTFETPVVLETGTRPIAVGVELTGDVDASNDRIETTTFAAPTVVIAEGMPYSEGFEGGPGAWAASGTNSSWAHGPPSATPYGFVAPAPEGMRVWMTNLAGPYNNNERSFLTSPCFDLSGLTADPTIAFQQVYRTNVGDSAWLEVSVDGGAWTKVGAAGTGTGWYDAGDVWASTTAVGWRAASHPVTGVAGGSVVRFRFVFSSDGSGTNAGIGVDAVTITP